MDISRVSRMVNKPHFDTYPPNAYLENCILAIQERTRWIRLFVLFLLLAPILMWPSNETANIQNRPRRCLPLPRDLALHNYLIPYESSIRRTWRSTQHGNRQKVWKSNIACGPIARYTPYKLQSCISTELCRLRYLESLLQHVAQVAICIPGHTFRRCCVCGTSPADTLIFSKTI